MLPAFTLTRKIAFPAEHACECWKCLTEMHKVAEMHKRLQNIAKEAELKKQLQKIAKKQKKA